MGFSWVFIVCTNVLMAVVWLDGYGSVGGFGLGIHCLHQCVDGCGLVGWEGFGGWVLGFSWECIVCSNVLMAVVW